jgi:predicted Fe-Mo cluster-binding NifX family protein
MKKIAVAQMNESLISKHFGRSPYFGIYTLTDNAVEGPEMRVNTFTHHAQRSHHEKQEHHEFGNHQHNHDHQSVVEGLSDCQVLIAGGMGMGAINSLSAAGVEVIITDNTYAEEAVREYRNGSIQNLDESCNK